MANLSKVKIACLGPAGTYSHLVSEKIFSTHAAFVLAPTIKQVFKLIKKKKADFGIVPIENTVAGIVQETIDALFINGLKVVGSYKMPIRHLLLARTSDKKKIKIIKSHNQALNQCKEWLNKNFPKAILSSESSSVEAMLKERDESTAFVGSLQAAQKYGLKILAKGIEDYKNNLTEFYVVSLKEDKKISKKLGVRNSIIIVTAKDRPGVLRDILSAFANRKLNLAKLHSRFNIFKGRDYFFFVEVECLMNNKQFKETIREIKKYCTSIKILGVV